MRAMAMGAACLALWGCATPVERASDNIQHYCLLSVQEDGGGLVQLDLSTNDRHFYPVGPMPHEVEVSPNSVYAYVSQFGMRDANHAIGTPGDHITRINLLSGETQNWMLPEGVRGPHGVRAHGGEVFTNAEIGDRMVVFDQNTGAVKRTFPLPELVHHFLFAHDVIYAFAAANGVYKIDPRDGRVLAHADIGSPARSVMMTRDQRQVLVAGRGEVVFLNAGDLSVARRVPVSGVTQIIYATLDEDAGLIYAPAPGENVVVALDLATGAERARVTPGRTPTMAVPGPDGRAYIPSVGETYITAVDPHTFATTQIGPFQRPNGIAFGSCAGA
ncbi:MAG TPA: PQQ-binding-like beta-propeller repeat protein [Caulobacterales bacterium]|nr:PQQ-binding-like beta-propeller repeat protein [Caulobacterales bacterium]